MNKDPRGSKICKRCGKELDVDEGLISRVGIDGPSYRFCKFECARKYADSQYRKMRKNNG
jgi:hypothetical protein